MKASRLSRVALSFIVMLAVVTGTYAAIDAVKGAGGPPVITVSGVALHPAGVTCGVETDCARVSWTATVPSGTVVTGFDIDLKSTRQNGTFESTKKSVAGSARQADMAAAFQAGTPVVSYVATVTARYTSVASASKSGSY